MGYTAAAIHTSAVHRPGGKRPSSGDGGGTEVADMPEIVGA